MPAGWNISNKHSQNTLSYPSLHRLPEGWGQRTAHPLRGHLCCIFLNSRHDPHIYKGPSALSECFSFLDEIWINMKWCSPVRFNTANAEKSAVSTWTRSTVENLIFHIQNSPNNKQTTQNCDVYNCELHCMWSSLAEYKIPLYLLWISQESKVPPSTIMSTAPWCKAEELGCNFPEMQIWASAHEDFSLKTSSQRNSEKQPWTQRLRSLSSQSCTDKVTSEQNNLDFLAVPL